MPVTAVLRRLGITPAEVSECAPGFSGARVWRVATTAAAYALKCYPPGETDRRRLEGIHSLLRHAADAGLPVPRPVGIEPIDQRLYDVVSWRPGRALLAEAPTADRCRAAGAAIARLHNAWRGGHEVTRPAPVFARRMSALIDFQSAKLDLGRLPPVWSDVMTVVVRRTPGLLAELRPWIDRPLPLQPCLGDCWHAHILFTGDAVTGLIDHAAVRVDYPLVDLARLLGSLSLTASDESHLLAGYESERKFRPIDWQLLPGLRQAGIIASLARWAIRLARGELDAATVAERRVTELLCQVDS